MENIKVDISKLPQEQQEQIALWIIEANKPKPWKPENGEDYVCIDGDGAILFESWDGINSDTYRYTTGNCYRTEAEAEFAREKALVIGELMQYAEELDWTDDEAAKWEAGYSYSRREIQYTCTFCYKTLNTPYFPSEESAQSAVAAVGEARIKKYLFGVE